MVGNIGKNHTETKQVRHSNVVIIDRISNLPHSILLHILSLLPTVDVIRTSLISKRWRCLWNSVPALEFCDVGVEEQKFYNFVNNCLEHRIIGKRHLNDLGINQFKLEMHWNSGSSVHVDRWLSFVVQQHLEELDLCIQPKFCIQSPFYYCIPSFYYCIPSLTVLKLDGLKLADEVFHNLIMGCPSLEKLFLHDCYGFRHLTVSSLNLESFELIGIDEADSILVEAVNLQSFLLETHGGDCNLNLVSCKNLKNLTLDSFHHIPNVEDAISELLILESLTVVDCEIHFIQYQYLKVLVLVTTIIEDDAYNSDHEMEITIDTSNLVSFHYEDVNFTYKVLLNSPNLEEANINLAYFGVRKKIDMNWYVDVKPENFRTLKL